MLLDCGGEEGPVDPRLLAALAVLTPNETELARLTGHLSVSPSLHKHCYSQALSKAGQDPGVSPTTASRALGATLPRSPFDDWEHRQHLP